MHDRNERGQFGDQSSIWHQRDRVRARDVKQEFESSVRRIVRGVIRRGRGSSRLAREILATAQRISQTMPTGFGAKREWLVEQVSRRLCELMVSEPRNRRLTDGSHWDTFRYECTLKVGTSQA